MIHFLPQLPTKQSLGFHLPHCQGQKTPLTEGVNTSEIKG
ncbi:hypothetical protein GLIP_2956 [Aliiglaciecola lipolytica E3]|uniref:Uncharacterized protein n=1 Tax=Aliiglaciecola lipolytica E3 TaxID=1127673 RepID=K6YBK2_9ALTE|nr:hypothetical protein GLIP_2956 [Aliiglaciecola lipolytica E3]